MVILSTWYTILPSKSLKVAVCFILGVYSLTNMTSYFCNLYTDSPNAKHLILKALVSIIMTYTEKDQSFVNIDSNFTCHHVLCDLLQLNPWSSTLVLPKIC